MFLLGAGSSLPANLPDMPLMTRLFLEHLDTSNKLSHSLRTKIKTLKAITDDHFTERKDLESFMTLIRRLIEAENDADLLLSKYPKLKKITHDELATINDYVQAFIRKKLENLKSANYLKPLQGFISEYPYSSVKDIETVQPLEIFTLNYDGVIDLFCEKSGINYADGFTPFWDPNSFETEVAIRVYRLHGCLYWFKTSTGKMIKLPIKGLKIDQVEYISGERLNEIIIYPTLEKEKFSELYSTLSNKFVTHLKRCDFCIVLGYSFRDKDIRDNIIEALNTNHHLWVIIVSPNATTHKGKFFQGEYSSRIAALDLSIQDVLRDGKLYSFIDKLKLNLSIEGRLLTQQYQNRSFLGEWQDVLKRYFYLGLNERIEYIRNTLVLSHGLDDKRIQDEINLARAINNSYWPN